MSKKPDNDETPGTDEEKVDGEGAEELTEAQLEQAAGGASDYLLELDGIKGESRDHKHKEWIDVLSVNPGAKVFPKLRIK